jgi:hypothetical protein
MKSTLTAAILIALGTSLPALAQVTPAQLAEANAACAAQGTKVGTGMAPSDIKVKADGKLEVACEETSSAKQDRKANTDAAISTYDPKITTSASKLYSFLGLGGNDALSSAKLSAGPAPVLTVIGAIILTLGSTSSTTSTSGTTP